VYVCVYVCVCVCVYVCVCVCVYVCIYVLVVGKDVMCYHKMKNKLVTGYLFN